MFWEVLFWKNAREAELLRDDYRWKVRAPRNALYSFPRASVHAACPACFLLHHVKHMIMHLSGVLQSGRIRSRSHSSFTDHHTHLSDDVPHAGRCPPREVRGGAPCDEGGVRG